jgi:hypothetical protein
MEQLTKEVLYFDELGETGHIYKAMYNNGAMAIVIGENGYIGKLSVNLIYNVDELGENEFFVKLYGESVYINDACFNSGLFEVVGEPFKIEDAHPMALFQKWRIRGGESKVEPKKEKKTEQKFVVSCTWGEGEDVMVTNEGKPYVLHEEPTNKNRFKHGTSLKGSVFLNRDEARSLALDLIQAADEADKLDQTAKDYFEDK